MAMVQAEDAKEIVQRWRQERQGLLADLSAGALTNFKRYAATAKDSGAEGLDAASLVDDQRF